MNIISNRLRENHNFQDNKRTPVHIHNVKYLHIQNILQNNNIISILPDQ